MLPVVLIFLSSWPGPIVAQDYSIPPQWVVSVHFHLDLATSCLTLTLWKNTTSSLSRDVRIQLASQLFDSLNPSYNPGTGQISGAFHPLLYLRKVIHL